MALEVPLLYPMPRKRAEALSDDLSGVPGAVRTLAREAREAGWDVTVWHSIGCLPHATTGRPGPEKDHWAVVVVQPAARAYAVYAGVGWHSVAVWDQARAPFAGCSVTDLREFLAGPRREQGWYDAIRARQRELAERAKASAAARPRKGREEAL